MTRKYITAAEADRLRNEAVALFTPQVSLNDGLIAELRARGIEYWIVPNDDPRVGTSTEQPEAEA